MITQIELEKLFEILSFKGDQTLDTCLSVFAKEFGTEAHVIFKFCYTLQNMILDNVKKCCNALVILEYSNF